MSLSSGIEPVGIDNLIHLERLPFLQPGVTVHYEGSIDKAGGNADGDWWLYQEGEGRWRRTAVDLEDPVFAVAHVAQGTNSLVLAVGLDLTAMTPFSSYFRTVVP